MLNINRRIEKLESKVQSMKVKAEDRQVKLLELQRLEKDDSIKALLLRLELEYVHTFTIVDVVAMASVEQTKDFSEVRKQRKATKNNHLLKNRCAK